jgi:hypothetical protein
MVPELTELRLTRSTAARPVGRAGEPSPAPPVTSGRVYRHRESWLGRSHQESRSGTSPSGSADRSPAARTRRRPPVDRPARRASELESARCTRSSSLRGPRRGPRVLPAPLCRRPGHGHAARSPYHAPAMLQARHRARRDRRRQARPPRTRLRRMRRRPPRLRPPQASRTGVASPGGALASALRGSRAQSGLPSRESYEDQLPTTADAARATGRRPRTARSPIASAAPRRWTPADS